MGTKTLTELKAEGYDLLATIQDAQAKLNVVNQQILEIFKYDATVKTMSAPSVQVVEEPTSQAV